MAISDESTLCTIGGCTYSDSNSMFHTINNWITEFEAVGKSEPEPDIRKRNHRGAIAL